MANNNNAKLGVIACAAIMIGGMIGSAIYSLSGLTLLYAGPSCIISWILAAVCMFFYAMAITEVASVYPQSGGTYVFPALILGKTRKQGAVWGWISGWCFIVGSIFGIAFSSLYLATYLGASFTSISGTTWQIVIAIIGVVFCMVLNLMKITDFGKFNNILVGILIVTMLIFIFVAMFSGVFTLENFSNFFTQGTKGATGWLSATPFAILAYGMAVACAYMAADVKNPNKTIPKALVIAMVVTVVLYILTLVAIIGLVSSTELQEMSATMGDFVVYIPMFAAIWTKLTGYAWLGYVVSISACAALLTSMLVGVATIARTMQATAEGGFLPKAFAKSNKNGVPGFATIVAGVIICIFCLFPSATELLVNLGALFTIITLIINFITLIACRKKAVYPEGAFRAPGGKVMPIVLLIVLLAIYSPDVINGNWMLWGFTGLAIAIALVIMAATAKKRAHLYED